MNSKILHVFFVLVVLVSVFAATAPAQTAPGSFPEIKIKNFGQMDTGYYRGAQPLPEDYKSLKEFGIKTIIDLRGDPKDYAKSTVESLGMSYVNIPMSGYKYPKEERVNEFLRLIANPETGPFFVHCKAGIHRTGVAGAAYRFTKYGWDYEQTYKEMKNYDFSAGLFHRAFKKYVKNYAERMQAQKAKTVFEQTAIQLVQ